jgi:hypothetical protein
MLLYNPPETPRFSDFSLRFEGLTGQSGGLNISFLEFRVKMLADLEGRGYSGLKEFLYSSMTSLMNFNARR